MLPSTTTTNVLLLLTPLIHPTFSLPLTSRALLTCGSTVYSPDEYSCSSNGTLSTVLPHGVNGTALPSPANQPQPTTQQQGTASPVPAGQKPHEGSVHTDDNDGSGTSNPPTLHPRALLTCGSTVYNPDDYSCSSNGALTAVLTHGVNGSALPAPVNQPVPTSWTTRPVTAGDLPHGGSVHIDDGGSGGTGSGGDGSGQRRRRGVKGQVLPLAMGGSGQREQGRLGGGAVDA